MDPMERFKLQLQVAANSKEVRLGQTKDHLVWRRWYTDVDGVSHQSNLFVFEQDDDEVICVEMASGPFDDSWNAYDDRDDFLDYVEEHMS